MREPGMNESGRSGFADSDLTAILETLRAPADIGPRPGFYARVMDSVEAGKQRSIWSIFLEPVFGTRLALASATLMALLGFALLSTPSQAGEETAALQTGAPMSFSEPLVLTEDGQPVNGGAAQAAPVALHQMNENQGREVVFVDLASYQGR